MALIAHLADVHLASKRLQSRLITPKGYDWDRREHSTLLAWDAARMLERSVEAAWEAGARTIVIAGDLFDVSRPDNREMRWAIRFFRRWAERGARFVAIPGDHDTPGGRDATPLEALAAAADGFRLLGVAHGRQGRMGIDDLRTVVDGVAFYAVPFIKVNPEKRRELIARVNLLISRAAKSRPGPRVLVAHYGLQGYTYEADAAGAPQELAEADYAAMGHVHKRFIVLENRTPFAYPGSLVPQTRDEADPSMKRGPLLVEVREGSKPVVNELVVEPVRAYLTVRSSLEELEDAIRRELARLGRVGEEPPLVHVVLRGVPRDVPERVIMRDLQRAANRLGAIIRLSEVRRIAPQLREVGGGEDLAVLTGPELEIAVLQRLLGGERRVADLVYRLKNALAENDMEEAEAIARELVSDELRPVMEKLISQAPSRASSRRRARPAGRPRDLSQFFGG